MRLLRRDRNSSSTIFFAWSRPESRLSIPVQKLKEKKQVLNAHPYIHYRACLGFFSEVNLYMDVREKASQSNPDALDGRTIDFEIEHRGGRMVTASVGYGFLKRKRILSQHERCVRPIALEVIDPDLVGRVKADVGLVSCQG